MLKINDLIVAFETEDGELTAVKGVSLTVKPGETLALVGESGCGKTVLCKSMLKILCEKGNIKQGQIMLEGKDLVPLQEEEMIPYRGSGIAMVFQDPMTSLDPTMSVGDQIAEMVKASDREGRSAGDGDGKTARDQAIQLMSQVGIDEPELRYDQMPHHFSGGMRQRIAIAIALAGKPKLLLADEPTTALDFETQAQILDLLKKIDIATIFITHDLSLVEDIADRVVIMQDGEIVEEGIVSQVFNCPQHPYTRKLLGYLDYGKGRGHNHRKSEVVRTDLLVEVDNLKKYFSLGRKRIHKVLDGFSLNIYRGEILGLVGPSGCGKSTLARCIMEMYPLTGGEIRFHNNNKNLNWKQMIFQDSASAFNPRMTVGDIIAEPLRVATGRKPERNIILDLMRQVELEPELIDRHPYEISGGQRQRAAIGRAISVNPELIVADEPISSLDISTQAQIVHLFRKLQEERNLTILFIAHDLPMVNHISDRIIEM